MMENEAVNLELIAALIEENYTVEFELVQIKKYMLWNPDVCATFYKQTHFFIEILL